MNNKLKTIGLKSISNIAILIFTSIIIYYVLCQYVIFPFNILLLVFIEFLIYLTWISALAIHEYWRNYQLLKDLVKTPNFLVGKNTKYGQKVACCGQIKPILQQTVTSPISNKPSIFYSYSVAHYKYVKSIDSHTGDYKNEKKKIIDYAGYYFHPSFIQTANNKQIKLGNVPILQGFNKIKINQYNQNEIYYQNFSRYLQYLNLNLSNIKFVKNANKVKAIKDEESRDKTKPVHQEYMNANSISDLSKCELEETVVAQSDFVTVIGAWMLQDQTIVSKPGINLYLIKGKPVKAQKNLRNTIIKSIIKNILLIFIILGIIIFFRYLFM